MAFSFANADKWSRFDSLESVVWRTQDLGSAEFREMAQLIGLSDWRAHLPQTATPRETLVAARSAMIIATGYNPNA